MLERLEAFRELVRHGNMLLGEVVSYCRDAEGAVSQLAQERKDLDTLRAELLQAQATAASEGETARAAVAQAEAHRRELAAIRADLAKAQEEVTSFQRTQNESATVLERSLREAKQHQRELEDELDRVRSQAAASRSLDQRLAQLDTVEAKLKATEGELSATRQALEEERSRRDRAIALIRPKSVREEAPVA